ncbi:retrovirus-related pol polyprotein from transposon TNT 1-94, partial [Tanacetum coccineum]
KMAEENVPAPAFTRSDEQILPFNAWLPVGKGNLLLDLQKQFYNILVQNAKTRAYNFQLDEQWFTLNADLLCKALEITHVDTTHPFVSPLAELLWEDFVQVIQIFFAHRANLNIPTKKTMPHVIPYCWFTKLIIYYLGSEHNIHRRPRSPVHVTGDDFLFRNLKFVPKSEKDDVLGKHIPKELITEAIQNSPYYQQYLEMVALIHANMDSPPNDEWEQALDISDSDLQLTPVIRPSNNPHTRQPQPPKHFEYVNVDGGIVTGCFGNVKKFLKNGKLEQVVALIKSCTPNALRDLRVTLKELSGIISGTIHYKVLIKDRFAKAITVGAALILHNVSVFSPKQSTHHYLNITKKNMVKVFHKDGGSS